MQATWRRKAATSAPPAAAGLCTAVHWLWRSTASMPPSPRCGPCRTLHCQPLPQYRWGSALISYDTVCRRPRRALSPQHRLWRLGTIDLVLLPSCCTPWHTLSLRYWLWWLSTLSITSSSMRCRPRLALCLRYWHWRLSAMMKPSSRSSSVCCTTWHTLRPAAGHWWLSTSPSPVASTRFLPL